ncbi:hypothetical protein AA0312_0749 [Acetobacter tropicalis NRIC 0312]|uniref:Uncharacterized protein n=1 Tax=Acetobacter tropicalis TaxID=104102 RepID=A0A511FQL9_9PROT|nr:hypothetical protein [Acetobacter tropicalis]GAL97091.1 hypothetical protein APA12_04830 [Acetobacter tropicalis]GBR68095.1 hypothetical protein AA0312_0749 [Acetobacter tropicalis NRIC 0312]GEL51247.1 hypothetical protein ATR01nite_23220 [Acetobacter tropicalis]
MTFRLRRALSPIPSVLLSGMPASVAARKAVVAGILLPALTLTGCGYFDSRTAHRAQLSLIGMSSSDVQGCIGVPDKVKKLEDGTEVYEYSRTLNIPATNDSTFIPLQSMVNIVETTLGGAGKTCIADIRVANGEVVDLHYSGDNDEILGADGVCSVITRGCVRRPMPDMQKVSNSPLGPVSGFRQPQIKGQTILHASTMMNAQGAAAQATGVNTGTAVTGGVPQATVAGSNTGASGTVSTGTSLGNAAAGGANQAAVQNAGAANPVTIPGTLAAQPATVSH